MTEPFDGWKNAIEGCGPIKVDSIDHSVSGGDNHAEIIVCRAASSKDGLIDIVVKLNGVTVTAYHDRIPPDWLPTSFFDA